jgi:OOP family OmpA-OmpF porin
LKLGLSEHWAFRLAGTLDYISNPKLALADNNKNLGAQAGLSVLFGNSFDRDKDGVRDGEDACPNTPRGEPVDATGCSASQRDSDRDGVKDNADKCPDTPSGETVDADGCSAGQKDADSDGVADAADQCPDTPTGEPVDARGCSRDSDADGVPDGKDECPSTPNGAPVDERGCRILFQGGEKRVVLQGVNFEFDKATLTEDSRAILLEVAKSLAANPGVRVEVGGHTDSKGSNAYNLGLSRERAKSVEDFLEANGVSPAQISSRGYGEARPAASNRTEEGRAQNRRVELNRLN